MASSQLTDGIRAEVVALGARVRQLRKRQGLSLEQLAGDAGVSPGLLSQLERGSGNPSHATLLKLAHAFDVTLDQLFLRPTEDRYVVRRADRKQLVPPQEDAVFELLTPDLRGPFEMLWIELQPQSPEPTPYEHDGVECVLVLDGSIRYELGGVAYQLETGDSITFPGEIKHRAINVGLTVARLIATIAPPSF